jgi:diguanylate cyclase
MHVDIDNFKNFNDSYGYQTGDQVLRLVAMALKSNIKGKDLAARYGGEEFVDILPHTDVEGAVIVAENIRRAIQAKELLKRSTNEKLGRIIASFGIAALRPSGFANRACQPLPLCCQAYRMQPSDQRERSRQRHGADQVRRGYGRLI